MSNFRVPPARRVKLAAPKPELVPVERSIPPVLAARIMALTPVPADRTSKLPPPVRTKTLEPVAEVSNCKVPADFKIIFPLPEALEVERLIPPLLVDKARAATASSETAKVKSPASKIMESSAANWISLLLATTSRAASPTLRI